MSDDTTPPLPQQPAEEAARQTPPAAASAPASAADIDDTGAGTVGDDVTAIGRGFFHALFDVSFRTFITRRLAGVFYIRTARRELQR